MARHSIRNRCWQLNMPQAAPARSLSFFAQKKAKASFGSDFFDQKRIISVLCLSFKTFSGL
jgi:hypothetical protein